MILTFIEHEDDEVVEESLEALTLARTLSAETNEGLAAVTVGPMSAAVTDTLGRYGVQTVHVLAGDELRPYAPRAWAEGIDAVIVATEPEAVLAGGIERGQEVMARLGALRAAPMAANCNEVTPGDPYTVIRQRWGGSLLEEAELSGDPKLLTVTPHETPAAEASEAVDPEVTEHPADREGSPLDVQLSHVEEADIEGVPLGEARVVVGGGRGVGSEDGFEKLEELADLLGGTVGSSRAAVNEGWRPHDDQIGLTGAKISPELYIPCGISGAVQHWVGCKGANHLLAINTDAEAAIIQKSNWAVIGDLHEVVPAVIEEIKDRQ